MHARDHRLELDPSRPDVTTATLHGSEHQFKAPFPIHAAPLLTIAQDLGLDKGPAGVAQRTAELASNPETITGAWHVIGAMVGMCWAHPDLDLDTPRPSLLDERGKARRPREYTDQVHAFGLRVVEELDREGYDPREVAGVFPGIMSLVARSAYGLGPHVDLAATRADFSAAQQDEPI